MYLWYDVLKVNIASRQKRLFCIYGVACTNMYCLFRVLHVLYLWSCMYQHVLSIQSITVHDSGELVLQIKLNKATLLCNALVILFIMDYVFV